MAKNLRAVVTVQKAEATTSYVKNEAVTSYQKAEAVAARVDFSINQWFYEPQQATDPGILLSELHVTVLNKNVTETLTLSEAPTLGLGIGKSETLSLLETFARVVTWNKSFTDAFTLDDAAQIDKDYYGTKGNVTFMLDVIGLSTAKIATDSVTVGDVYNAAVNKVVTENLSLIETQVKSFNKPLETDTLSFVENIDVGRSLNKSHSFSFSDAYYATLSKIVNNSMTMTS